jgi:hypothetical protein
MNGTQTKNPKKYARKKSTVNSADGGDVEEGGASDPDYLITVQRKSVPSPSR